MATFEAAGFGGGCHWCTESVFLSLRGVDTVDQGFIASDEPYNSFSEAVRISFDTQLITFETLIEIHLHTHSSTSPHKFREKYRSAVYVTNKQQAHIAKAALANLQEDFPAPIVTQVLPLVEFKSSEERYHDYYRHRKNQAFCIRYIDPKLEVLRKRFGFALKEENS